MRRSNVLPLSALDVVPHSLSLHFRKQKRVDQVGHNGVRPNLRGFSEGEGNRMALCYKVCPANVPLV